MSSSPPPSPSPSAQPPLASTAQPVTKPPPKEDKPESAEEYIPPAAAPSLSPTESTRRLQALLRSKKLSLSTKISFTYNETTFFATPTPQGALSAPAPRLTASEPTRLSQTVHKVYPSPSEFASEMVALALTALPPQNRPRGSVAVNGWNECRVDGRSLAAMRNEMLHEKKTQEHAAPQSLSPDAEVEPGSSQPQLKPGSSPAPAGDYAQPDQKSNSNEPVDSTQNIAPVEEKTVNASVENHPATKSQDEEEPSTVVATATDKVVPASPEPKKEKPCPIKPASPSHEKPVLEASSDHDSKAPSPEPVMEKKNRGEKRMSHSPLKPETKRRKRNDPNESSPSDINTPSRRSQERTSRPRSNWAGNGRKHDIPSASEMDTDGLDPDAIEAVAIAAQAEKEEANTRARRTTRLAAGKIKQVDYKASASASGSRCFSPGNEYDDSEANANSNDSATEPTRTARRKTTVNQAVVPQRSSRRVARMRSSQEKDQSSGDEVEVSGTRNSSGGNDSDAQTDGDAAGQQDEMEIETATATKANGTRAEGREQKRATSKRTRQNRSESADGNASEKCDDKRPRTREGSSGDAAEPTEIAEDNKGSSEDHERTYYPGLEDCGAFGWDYYELSRIGDAVDIVESIDPEKINGELDQNENWKAKKDDESIHDRVQNYVRRAVVSIEKMKKEKLGNDKGKATVGELRAYIATDVWRLKHKGWNLKHAYAYHRPDIIRKIAEEDGQVSRLDRTRRKWQREVDDLRSKLDGEMEAIRKVDLEVAYADFLHTDQKRDLLREEARLERLQRDTERYNLMEEQGKLNLEHTKVLVHLLRGELDTPDEGPSQAMSANQPVSMKRDEMDDGVELVKPEAPTGPRKSVVDEDVVMKAVEDAKATDISQRQIEIDRYHALIGVWEAEAEANQRLSERLRMQIVNVNEAKARLEAELYLSRSSNHAGPGVLATPTSNARKFGTDQSRKGDNRGSGLGAHRGSVGSRGKSGHGKSSGPNAVGSGSKSGTVGRPKSSNGKNGESSKGKRRATGSNGTRLVEVNGASGETLG